jgi:hypothetical protein
MYGGTACFRFLFPRIHTDSGANSALTEEATAVFSLGVNWPGSEIGHSHHRMLRDALPLVTPTRPFDVVLSKAQEHPSLLHLTQLL